VLQSSLNVERELGKKLVVSGSYRYVHGEHLIRAATCTCRGAT
jgi:hypothetical protein